MNPQDPLAVIGGGIVGLAVADALCCSGAQVTVIEQNALASGTTNNTFSWLNATSKTDDEAYHRLNAAGVAEWRALAAENGEEIIGLHPIGMLEWADGANASARADLERRAERLSGWEYPARLVNLPELEALEPHVAFPPKAMGLLAFGDAWLDAPKAASFLAERVRRKDGRILEGCTATGVRRGSGRRPIAVETDEAPVTAARVIVAAGPESSAVLAGLTGNDAYLDRAPIRAVPGALIETPPTSPWKWVHRIVYSEHYGSLHARPAPNGGLLLGGDDPDAWIANGHDDKVLARIETHLLDCAKKMIPKLPVDSWRGRCGRRVGVRPMPSDGRSIIGAVPEQPGLYIASTHSGVTLAPVIGRCLAELVLTGSTPSLIAPFTYDRFQQSE